MTFPFFSFTLGQFDPDDAVRALPAQLTLLRSFRDLRNPRVALVYRLETHRAGKDLHALFRVMCVGETRRALTQQQRNSLYDLAEVAFLAAWGLDHDKPQEQDARPALRNHVRLRPVAPQEFVSVLKVDWGPLVDLVRYRRSEVCIDFICRAPGQNRLSATRLQHDEVALPPVPLDGLSGPFAALPRSHDSESPLSVQCVVRSDTHIDRAFLVTVGQLFFGFPTEPEHVSGGEFFDDTDQVGLLAYPEIALRVFHPPLGGIQGRGLEGQGIRQLPLQFDPTGVRGTTLGVATWQRGGRYRDQRAPLVATDDDRLKHIYVVGKTGSGKTNFLKTLVQQDIRRGLGVAVIDPHGELADHALTQVESRESEVTYLDFSDRYYVPIVNPLLIDANDRQDRTLSIEELTEILVSRSFNQFTGPVFEDYARMMLSSLDCAGVSDLGTPSVTLAVAMFTADKPIRDWVISQLRNSNSPLADKWRNLNRMQQHDLAELVRWVEAKFTAWSPSGTLRSLTSGSDSPLSFERIVRERQILIVKLPENRLGREGAEFIGALVFARLHRAALGLQLKKRRPFTLYVDEFQRFVGLDIERLIAEARKFNLSLTLAHQNLGQLDGFLRYEGTGSRRLREALFGNAGTIVSMKTSGSDIEPLSVELGVPPRVLQLLPQFTAVVRPVIGGRERSSVTLRIPHANSSSAENRKRIRIRMISEGYWQKRSVTEKDINATVDRLRRASDLGGVSGPPLIGRPAAKLSDDMAAVERERQRSS